MDSRSPVITGVRGDSRPPALNEEDSPLARSAVSSEITRSTSFPKSKIKILLVDGIHQNAIDMFKREGFQVEALAKISPAELKEKIKDVHAIGVRSKTQLTSEVLAEAKRLLAVGCFCIGTDQTDLDAAEKLGIPVFNAPFSNTRSVAEMIIAEMIVLARQLGDRSSEMHNGLWNKVSANCYEVRGKTVGIIGYGHVGSQVSVLAESLGMHVLCYDVVPKLPLGNATIANSLEDLLCRSDFVTLHVPGTPATQNLIGAREVAMMKKGSYLLNASRGPVVEVDSVAAALRSGHLAGAAFDVFPVEPNSNKEPYEAVLKGCPNTILTPHIGGSTEEAQAKIGLEVAAKLIKIINTGCTLGAVNFPNVDLPVKQNTHRILNTHRNVPGVLRDINNILSQHNITGQVLSTTANVGYVIAELDGGDVELSNTVVDQLKSLDSSIRTRVLY